ncbi:MAG TPA: serine hydrolase domain-containing protein, partial [Polyangiaceae bacterium]|nr:serine hydrolase domain-containing protein [Polyangiaceae bacterium]
DAAQQALADRLDAAARAALVEPDLPVAGFAIHVVSKGTTLFDRGYGYGNSAARQRMPADGIFRIGSITKQFTAAAVLQLEEQGKLELGDSLSRFLKQPYLKDASRPLASVTLEQLLTQTSGVPSYTDLPRFVRHRDTAVSPEELVTAIAELPLDFEPGTRFVYSNSNYYLLGLVVEQVSGQSYAEYLRQHVFAPAGLVETRYCPDAQDYPRAVLGYERSAGEVVPAHSISMTLPFSAGALCSSAGDLVRWAQALAGGRVVKPESFARMSSQTQLKSGQRSPYGFGLFLGDLAGHPRIGHGGGIDGFSSDLQYYPADDLYIAVLVNTASPLAGLLGERLARIALNVPEPELKDLPVLEADVQPLLGTYYIAEFDQTLRIAWRDGALRLSPAQQPARSFRLRAQGQGVYAVPELKARLRFELEGGQARALLGHQMGHDFRGQRVP